MGSARRRRTAALLMLPLLTALALLVPSCRPDGPGTRAMGPVLPSDAAFTHPGVLVDRAQLDALREHVTAGRQPWRTAYLALRDSPYGSYRHRARPHETVVCPAGDLQGRGCAAEREDALAAYAQALLFAATGDRRHAEKARQLMDAWAATLRRHTGEKAALQAGWTGSVWARAAEIVRHTPGGGWPAARVRGFEDMLRTAHLPQVVASDPDFTGSWDLVAIDAVISVAVFLGDHRVFGHALERFRERVPAYLYLEKDGPVPLTVPGSGVDGPQRMASYWFGQTTYRDGVSQETCHSFRHVGASLAATAHIAETAWHQGVDLYGEIEDRLAAALALHARHELDGHAPEWLCGGRVERGLGPHLEVALHHLEERRGRPVPAAHELAVRARPTGTDDLFTAWETLTHASAPDG
ncbi:alginate lyase family protein [Streptomyces sp. NPDC050674]|uniref:alginate lyase family protein n=1 Tax=Streptomyces sp. NPDC050674 TaxID=3157216 RepID=UPI003434C12E